VVTGGKVDAQEPGPTLANSMRNFLVDLGVPETSILLEDRSRNTYENARYSAELLRARRISHVVLVTDAMHLPRAARCFQAQGLQVIPSGVRYRAARFDAELNSFLPSPSAAVNNQRVLHEWLGMAWYWLNGRFESAGFAEVAK
jgi:uncharacterized SAM-binding protein YcdF (DUF218 family)